MGWILLTNDDGVESPALVPLIHELREVAEVRVVVPDRERSWIGKAITRHHPVLVDSVIRDGITITTTTGYPADCVQLGINTLYPDPPQLVVSGINIGYNHGSGYIQSSGTVGAAMEALLGGVPAAAFSAGSRSRPWPAWKAWVHEPDGAEMWSRLAGIAADITGRLLTADPPDFVLNVNMPDDATSRTPRRVTTVARVGYDRLFRRESDGRFVHDYGGGLRPFAGLEGTDVEAASDGVVAITAVMPMAGGRIDEGLGVGLGVE